MEETIVVSLGSNSGDAREIRTTIARQTQARDKCNPRTRSSAPREKPWKKARAAGIAKEAFDASTVFIGKENVLGGAVFG